MRGAWNRLVPVAAAIALVQVCSAEVVVEWSRRIAFGVESGRLVNACLDSQDNLIVASSGPSGNSWLLKFDPNGVNLWVTSALGEVMDLIPIEDGSLLVTAAVPGQYDRATVSVVGSHGVRLWSRAFAESPGTELSVAYAPGMNRVAIWDGEFVHVLAMDGTPLRTFPVAGNDALWMMYVEGQGLVTVGLTDNYSPHCRITFQRHDLDGTLSATSILGPEISLYSVFVSAYSRPPDGSYILSGEFTAADPDTGTLVLSSDGSQLIGWLPRGFLGILPDGQLQRAVAQGSTLLVDRYRNTELVNSWSHATPRWYGLYASTTDRWGNHVLGATFSETFSGRPALIVVDSEGTLREQATPPLWMGNLYSANGTGVLASHNTNRIIHLFGANDTVCIISARLSYRTTVACQLEGVSGGGRPVQWWLETPAGETVAHGGDMLDAESRFVVDSPRSGAGRLRVKASHWLSASLPLSVGDEEAVALTLINGDATGDNRIDIRDFFALRSAFGTREGDPGFLPSADFDESGSINIMDALILRRNFGKVGT